MLSPRAIATVLLTGCLFLPACSQLEQDGDHAEPAEDSSFQGETSEAPAPGERVRRESARSDSGSKAGQPRTYFQYVDDQGSVRFVESFEDVPEAWRDRAGRITLSAPPGGSAGAARVPRQARRVVRTESRRQAASSAEVNLYYADWCPYCRKAKAHLDRRGVSYRLLDIDIAAVKRELVEKTGRKSIPFIEIGDEKMHGYSEERLDQLLSQADLI